MMLLAAALALAIAVPAAAETAPIETIVQDDALMLHSSEEQIRVGLEHMRELGIDRVRLTAGWSVLAPSPDASTAPSFDATDPAAYPAANWMNLDRAVRLSVAAGIAPMIDIAFWAPRWATKEAAEVPNRLAAEVDPARFAEFAQAVARRYTGTWTPTPLPATLEPPAPSPDGDLLSKLFGNPQPPPSPREEVAVPKPLPAVDTFTVWNEPNHPGFLRPQWVKRGDEWTPRSAEIYREMVRQAYPAIKSASPAARVLIGGTAAMGSSTPGLAGVTPLRFLRALACVDSDLQPITTGTCANYQRLPGDGWAHHPYSLRTTPDVDPKDPDKLPVAATQRLANTLRALVDSGRLDPKVGDLYMTEYGYETNLPDPRAPFSLAEQGRLLAWAEYLATRVPSVRSWPQFQLYDRPNEAPREGMREFGDWQSGLYFNDGTPKPSAATYATPAFAECVKGSQGAWALVWGRLRGRGKQATATVQARTGGGEWRAVKTFDRPQERGRLARASVSTDDGRAVTRYVRHEPRTAYRLRWSGDTERTSPSVSPSGDGCRAIARKARARR